MAMSPFYRGGPAPVPSFDPPKMGERRPDMGRPASSAPAPWTQRPQQRQQSVSLFSYSDPWAKKQLDKQYAEMVGKQTEALRQAQADRQKQLSAMSPEFQSRYGTGAQMTGEYQTAYAGADPELGKIQSYRDFALGKGIMMTPQGELVENVAPAVAKRFGYSGWRGGTYKTNEQQRAEEQQMLAELPPYMRQQYMEEKQRKQREEAEARRWRPPAWSWTGWTPGSRPNR